MTTHVILQARVSSTRLPGKVLKLIIGKAMLAHQIARVQRAKLVDKIIIATSEDRSDDAIAQLCEHLSIPCFRGNLLDVLDRFYQASLAFPSEVIVRLTGDCPLIDSDIIDEVIDAHLNGSNNYTSNCEPASFPDGLDVEVFNYSALKTTWTNAKKPSEREHVTLFIRNHPELFSCGSVQHDTDLSNLRWTVDEKEDFIFVEQIYQALYRPNPAFTFNDILHYLEQYPDVAKINQSFTRNEGLLTSEKKDKEQGYD
ncbi:glycosyltransferase family protein [Paraglaciecola sp.]|jgi:spore coat polysaccharide biosynthesis protein SpsF|nr:glycosyltransferase family protein [Paraglaciecola sp.]MDB4281777.1 glycosyltransferase family protein [Paraglaciecola sp.]